MLTFERIEELAKALPGTEVSSSYGTPAIKVAKKLVLRLHQKEDAIVLMLDTVEQQQDLIHTDPMSFYITDHYSGYPAVLVRPTVDEAMFSRLLEAAWRRVARKSDLAAHEAKK